MKALVASLLVFLVLVAFTGQVCAADAIVVMSSDAEIYREALEGFRETARFQIAGVQNLKDNPTAGRDELRKLRSVNRPDLIFALGTPAFQLVVSEITDVPVVHAMVFNPFSVPNASGKNISGISMNPSANQVIAILKELNPKYRRIGVLFDPSRSGPLISLARSAAQKEGVQLVAREIRAAADIAAALKSLENEIDILWLWPDDIYLTDDILQRVFLFSFDKKIPVFGLSERHTQMGALISLSYASAKDIGRQVGEMANRRLGEITTSISPYASPRQTKLTVNQKTARKLSATIPEALFLRADNAVKAPIYRNGDWWLFRIKRIYPDGKSEVEEHRVTFRGGAFQTHDTSFLRGEDIPMTPSFLPFATVYLTDPARKWLDFPLIPGKTWRFQYRRRSFTTADDLKPRYFGGGRAFTWVEASVEVVGQRSVVTPAGKFDAVEINRLDSLHRAAHLTYFYSPQSKSVVKLEADIDLRDSETGATRFELEMIAFGTEAVAKSDSR
jgi:putative ABC transport system substrate-binding protein